MVPIVSTVLKSNWQSVDARQMRLGEGARYFGDRSPRSGEPFLLVNLLGGELFSTSGEPRAGVHQLGAFDRPLGAVAPLRGRPGQWIAALGQGLSLLSEHHGRLVETATWDQPASDRPGQPELRVNDALADPTGRFWAGAMAYNGDAGCGLLWCRDADGEVRMIVEGISIPNGPAFTEDGTRMFFTDSPSQQIHSYKLDAESGAISSPEPFAAVHNGVPDGMVVDSEGCLWQTVFGDAALLRLSPDGDLLERFDLPVRQPTSVALSAQAPYRAIVTSAANGLEDPGPMDGCVITAEISAAGVEAYSAA